MKKIIISTLAIGAFLSVTSCIDFDTDVAEMAITNGEADFTTYVALGNSLTSGYRDGALYLDGQLESYPNIMAQQMQKAGGGEFKQPLISDNIGGMREVPGMLPGKYTLKLVNGVLTPVPSAPTGSIFAKKLEGKFNNMGVPGAKSYNLVTKGFQSLLGLLNGTANPYYMRIASSNSSTMLSDAVDQSPTFYSLWIGSNDVLSYATSGGVGKDQTGNTDIRRYGFNDISDPSVVAKSIEQVLKEMEKIGAKGVIANIPYVTSIPFFNTVPSKPFGSLTKEQVAGLNAAYAKYNEGLAVARTAKLITEEEYQSRLISFSVGKVNGAVIEDKDLTNLSAHSIPSWRQTTEKDFILITSLADVRKGAGTSTQLVDKQVLTEKEARRVKTAIDAYNIRISALAQTYNLAFVDANAKMIELGGVSGIQYNGVSYSASFITGGAFSLDAVHMTGKGYAVLANEFIKAINAKYGSTLPQVNPNNYSGITFP